MPSQPVIRSEQAPEPHPLTKISLISKGAHGPRIRYYADKNRYYTLILAKRPRSDTIELKARIFELYPRERAIRIENIFIKKASSG